MDVLKGRKYNIITFGCQMNEHDSETISGMLKEAGCEEILSKDEADITVINTCSIRENADKRFFGTLGQLKKHKLRDPEYIGLRMRMHDAAAAYHRYAEEQVSMGGYHIRDAQYTSVS